MYQENRYKEGMITTEVMCIVHIPEGWTVALRGGEVSEPKQCGYVVELYH